MISPPNIASTSATVFVPPSNNVETKNNNVKTNLASENIEKVKSILGAPPKQDKKEVKTPRAKKANSQKPKQKKQHLCHHCGAAGHTRPNCYKWLATQQSNGMIASGNQNQFPSSLAPLEIFSKPHTPFELEQFQFFPLTSSSRIYSKKRFFQGMEGKGLQVILSLFLFLFLFFFLCSHYLCVLLSSFESV